MLCGCVFVYEGKMSTVKLLNIWIPKKVDVIVLKFEQDGFTTE